MRIGLVAFSDYQRFPLGGGLSFLRLFAEAVRKSSGHEVVMVGWSEQRDRNLDPKRVRVGAFEFDFVPVGGGVPPSLLPDRAVFRASTSGWKRAMLEVGHVDVFYCHSPESLLGVRATGSEAPAALHLHGARDAIGRSRFVLGRLRAIKWAYERIVLGPALRGADAVLATISKEEHAALERSLHIRSGARCVRVPGMVTSRAATRRPWSGTGPILLTCVGRVESVKGIELPILAVAELQRRGIDCRLRVIGEGRDQSRLSRLAKSLSIHDRIQFLGRCDAETVASHLCESQAFVSGSRQEGFSLALLEALAQGVPAVVTDVGSAREVVISGRTGEIVPNREPALFADALLKVLSYANSCEDACREAAAPYSSANVSSLILHTLEGIAASPDLDKPDPRILAAGIA